MSAPRRIVPAAAVAAFALSSPFLACTPAAAHGAPTKPVSRAFACSPDGGSLARTAACEAALATNGQPFTFWDNVRVSDVNGRDRQVIPDGQLCSGGLPAYKGLDLARADWPSTRMTPGAALTMTYRETIPHTGTFRLYLTEEGYDPTRPLTWSELPSKPFAQVTDPPLTDGAYRIRAKLPSDRTGRQVLYTVWQNSSTTDTYYSCSDVVFPGKASAGSAGGGAKKASPSASSPSANAAAKGSGDSPSPSPSVPASSSGSPSAAADDDSSPSATTVPGTPAAADAGAGDGGPSTTLVAGGAAVAVLAAGAALVVGRRRKSAAGDVS